MSEIDWEKIIKFIAAELIKGLLTNEAVAKASAKFGVSESAIRNHGGF